jgi:subtilisin family serine protease
MLTSSFRRDGVAVWASAIGAFVVLCAAGAHSDSVKPGAPGALLVRLAPGFTPDRLADVGAVVPVFSEPIRYAARAEKYGLNRYFRVSLGRGANVAAAIAELNARLGVERVELDGPATLSATIPNDPFFSQLWGLHNTGQNGGTPGADIHAPEAWDLHTGNGTVTLAIIDTGIQPHPDLQLVPGWNTLDNNADTHDGNGHGTMVAGIAGARGNNGVGVVGVIWNVNLMPVKCVSDGGYGTESTIAMGIVWAADHGAQVANLSLTTYVGSGLLHGTVQYAHDQGVVLVASVGSNQSQGIAYPARFEECLAVGATDSHDQWASFSVYGPEIDVVAPGVGILSTYPDGWYTMYSGVSMATSYVSGLAVLLRSYSPTLTNTQVEGILRYTADDLGPAGWDDHYGWGRINALRALQHADPHGDLNCDGIVDFDDINAFVLALSGQEAYQAAFPNCHWLNADCDQSGSVDFDDINAFVALLSG